VSKSMRFDDTVIRQRKCVCGFTGRSDENWAQSISGQKRPHPGQQPPPTARKQPLVATPGRGGVGGGLSGVRSGSDPVLNPDPSQQSESGAHAIPQAPFVPPLPPVRIDTFAAANSAHFDRVYAAYPRKDARRRAGEAFWLLAATFPGGEPALADAILAALPAMLKRHPYTGPNATRPFLDKVLSERRWEDPESAPDTPKAADSRCNLHRQQGTFRQLPRGGPVAGCSTCKENAAARGTRESEPTPVAPAFKPPPEWTAEQKAEMAEAVRKAPALPRAAAGGAT
jgi:hypothetical protein